LVWKPGAPGGGAELGVPLTGSVGPAAGMKALEIGSFQTAAFFGIGKLFLRCRLASCELYPVTFKD